MTGTLEALLRGGRLAWDTSARIAAGLAKAMEGPHAAGRFDFDLRPSTVLISTGDDGRVQVPVGGQLAPGAESQAEVDWAHISPEHTGRLNRPVDQRSNLYSLGILLYRMLTGKLPFAASTPLEWAHCHIARVPVPPAEVAAAVPTLVSDIAVRLLAKEPDERYQTARGLRLDLERCLAEPTSSGQIAPFALGASDISKRLRIPPKAFGRQAETAALEDTIRRFRATGRPCLGLVSGPAGIGKSLLVYTQRKAFTRAAGLFLTGKFDPYQRDIPFAALARAFQDWAQWILAGSPHDLAAWRRRLTEALADQAGALACIVPALELLLGEPPPLPDLPPMEASHRRNQCFRRFLSAIAPEGHPLLLFLDDLQWADAASLGLVAQALSDPETRNLMVVGAWRDAEAEAAPGEADFLAGLRQADPHALDIKLAPLDAASLTTLLAETLGCGSERAALLAEPVLAKTAGNPFFVKEFLETLHRDGLFAFDAENAAWHWDLAQVGQTAITANVVDLLAARIGRLAPATTAPLLWAACLGHSFEPELLVRLAEGSVEEIGRHLAVSEQEGLVLPEAEGGERKLPRYRWAHDGVRQAAYSLIPAATLPRRHLAIARALAAGTDPEKATDPLFETADHFGLGAQAIVSSDERALAAHWHLAAARKAKSSTALGAAVRFVASALRLLGESMWQEHPALALPLHLVGAECQIYSGNFAEGLRLARAAKDNARTNVEKADAYFLLQFAATACGDQEEARDGTLEALSMLGIDLRAYQTWDDILAERARIHRLLGQRSIESLIELGKTEDPAMAAALRCNPLSYDPDRRLVCAQVARMVSVSLEYGASALTPLWFGMYALHLAGQYRELAEARRFAELGLAMSQQRKDLGASEAIGHLLLGITLFWTGALADTLRHFNEGLAAARASGNQVLAAIFGQHLGWVHLAKGEPLAKLWLTSAEPVTPHFAEGGMSQVIDRHFIRSLRESGAGFPTLAELSKELERAGLGPRVQSIHMHCWFWIRRLQACFHLGDLTGAREAGERLAPIAWSVAAYIPFRDYVVYDALALAATLADATETEKAVALAQLSNHAGRLAQWAEVNPGQFQHLHDLVSAERARVTGNERDAARLYERSIQGARAGRLVPDEALACRAAAASYRASGYVEIANLYLGKAEAAYLRWGADAVARKLEEAHPGALTGPAADRSQLARPPLPERLDLSAAVKAAQAVSAQIVLDRLIDTLMHTVLESAGATRGCLLLTKAGRLAPAALATLERHGVQVQLLVQDGGLAEPDLPLSVLDHVGRTRDKVLIANLEEAAHLSPFAQDPYFARTDARSVLCFPILRQAELVGALYLENPLVAGAFTPQRLGALELLAAQAAISLENARLLGQEQVARAAAEEIGRRQELLAAASALLAESLDDKVVLARLTEFVVGRVADACVVDLVEDGQIRRVANAHRDPDKRSVLAALGQRYPMRWDSPQGAVQAIKTGQTLVFASMEDYTDRHAVDEEHRRLLEALGTHAAVAVPLKARGRVLGCIGIGTADSQRRFVRAEVELIEEIARRAAIAIDNAQLHRQTEAAVRARDEFLIVASHELNTPVSTLILALQELKLPGEGQPRPDVLALDRVALVERQGMRLKRLVRELLDATLLDCGALPFMAHDDVEIGALVRSATAGFGQELARARCTLAIEQAHAVVGHWDPNGLAEVVKYLLSNAVKFGAGKPIEIRIDQIDDRARLAVCDHGIGIAAEQIPHVFGRYTRGVSVENYGGLGLGLYISRGIVEAHDGSIAVVSTPGQDTTFTVELPGARPHAMDSQAHPPLPAPSTMHRHA